VERETRQLAQRTVRDARQRVRRIEQLLRGTGRTAIIGQGAGADEADEGGTGAAAPSGVAGVPAGATAAPAGDNQTAANVEKGGGRGNGGGHGRGNGNAGGNGNGGGNSNGNTHTDL
jgi:hypothetical protein